MTDRQLQLLTFIRNAIIHDSKIPTYREMKEFMSVSSNKTLEEMLAALIRDGYLEKNKEKYRGIRLAKQGMTLDNQIHVDKNETSPLQATFTLPSNATTGSISYSTFVNGTISHVSGSGSLMKGGEKNGTK